MLYFLKLADNSADGGVAIEGLKFALSQLLCRSAALNANLKLNPHPDPGGSCATEAFTGPPIPEKSKGSCVWSAKITFLKLLLIAASNKRSVRKTMQSPVFFAQEPRAEKLLAS